MTSKIIVYSKDYCPYCVRAKNLLTAKKLEFTEINISGDEKLRDECFVKSNGRKTVPQIFIGKTHIGGFDDLNALNSSGKLQEILEAEGFL